MLGGVAPVPQAAGAGNPVEFGKAKPKSAQRSAETGERVTRAFRGTRQRVPEGVGAPRFSGAWAASSRTSGRPVVQTGEAALLRSRNAAVRP